MKIPLDEIVSDISKLDPELKAVITKYRQEQERSTGSEVWPEVEQFITSMRSSIEIKGCEVRNTFSAANLTVERAHKVRSRLTQHLDN